jgi:phenylalanyl-tRNA synthetase beta chain
MLISLNWLKKYVDLDDVGVDELVERIGSRLVEVERVEYLGPNYKAATIVEVRSAEKIADSDHLSLCQIWDGENEVQVVCGAPNVRAGMLAVWLPPESIVPETYGTPEPFKLEARKLRGHISNGMLASERELGLGDSHEGIVEIGLTRGPEPAKAGDSFAEIFELDDAILDIENKSLTHRPDCFGVIGFAREVGAILGKKFTAPEWFNQTDFGPLDLGASLPVPTVAIANPEICARYQCAVVKNVNGEQQSSLPDKAYLARVGARPVSYIVDLTNFKMFESGQPLHAFDYDKLVAVSPTGKPDILVRLAEDGEKLVLLDGREATLTHQDIVIAAGDQSKSVPIALAGAMGGESTAIGSSTKNILLESATFNLYNLRGTQFRHGIFSESITRFTKGQPAGLTDPVLRETVRLLLENMPGAALASEFVDEYPDPVQPTEFFVPMQRIFDTLGKEYAEETIFATLENLGYGGVAIVDANPDGRVIEAKAPWWRTDLRIDEDLIEDIGRVNGFDNIPAVLPTRQFAMPKVDVLGLLKSRIRTALSAAGTNEILTYSFVSERLLKNVEQDPAESYEIVNSISPALQYERQSLAPSLLEKTYLNTKVPFGHFALFELNQVYAKSDGLTEEKVPRVRQSLALVVADRKRTDAAYYEAKKYAEYLFGVLNIPIVFAPLPADSKDAASRPFEPKRSARITSTDGKITYGVIGEFKNSVRRNLKLPQYTAGFEADVDLLLANLGQPTINPPVENTTEKDLTFKVEAGLEYAKLADLVQSALTGAKLWFKLQPVSVYQGDDKATKNVTLRINFADYDKILSTDEIAAVVAAIAKQANEQLNAEVI